MDPTFVNWALYNGGFDTVRIAIGDNLVKKPFVGDLMRINKSFIVRRSVSRPSRNLTDLLSSLRIHQTIHRGEPFDLDRPSGGVEPKMVSTARTRSNIENVSHELESLEPDPFRRR